MARTPVVYSSATILSEHQVLVYLENEDAAPVIVIVAERTINPDDVSRISVQNMNETQKALIEGRQTLPNELLFQAEAKKLYYPEWDDLQKFIKLVNSTRGRAINVMG